MPQQVARLSRDGGIVIPASYRKILNLRPGDDVLIRLQDQELVLSTPAEAVRQARALIHEYIPPGTDLASELIEDRRREHASDNA